MSLNLDRSAWKRVRLGDVILRSRTQVDPVDVGVDRYVAGGHVDTESVIIQRSGGVADGQMGSTFRYSFKPGQVLFVSARPYLRKVGVPDFAGVVADKTYVLEAVPGNGLLHEMLPFLLTSDRFVAYATQEATGSMTPRLLWGAMQRYEFDLPQLDEQRRIADLLWAIERHRQNMATTAQQIKETKSLVLAKCLADGVEANGWPRRAVSELVTSGPTNGKSAIANDERRGIPSLSISAVRGGVVVGGDAVKYMDVPADSINQFVLQMDDFLIVRGNGNKHLTGLGGLVVGGLPDGCVYPDLLIRLRFDKNKILPEFAGAQWNNGWAHEALLRNAKSTNGIWKINGKDVKNHALIIPPLDRQREIMSNLSVLDTSISASHDELAALALFRAIFWAKVFEGGT